MKNSTTLWSLLLLLSVELISPSELYSQMLSYEQHVDKQSSGHYTNTHANAASRGRGGPWTRGGSNTVGCGRGCGNGRGPGRGSLTSANHGSYSNSNYYRGSSSFDGQNRPRCQVYFKPGHTTNICWYRFDEDYVPDGRLIGAASSSIAADLNWYL
jgi:hypothetical protein